jgi:hypothetical protein
LPAHKEHVKKAIARLKILKEMEDSAEAPKKDQPHTFKFSQLNHCSLYNAEDHNGTADFYGQRMFAEEDASEKDPYSVRIFAFHVDRTVIVKRKDQRMELRVQRLEKATPAKPVGPLPVVTSKQKSR